MRLQGKLIVAALKMFFRQKEAWIWSIILPLFMVFLFSFVNFDGFGSVSLGIANQSRDTTLVSRIRSIKAFRVTEGSRAEEMQALVKGDRVLLLSIPESFTPASRDSLTLYVNAERPSETQVGRMILQRVLDEIVFQQSNIPRLAFRTEMVNSRNQTYIDFLLPGILAMSIMQSGLFGVSFTFVIMKKRGILRRLLATPIKPSDFIVAQVVSRLFILMLQTAIMVGAGMVFFHLHFIGSLFDMLVVGILGGVIFLAIGFALSGISKSEDQVAPLANVISLPMMFLSGVFFSRSNLPGIAHTITSFFPLTYLADGLRTIAVEGATLPMIWPEMLGLVVWTVIAVFLAIKAFRWE